MPCLDCSVYDKVCWEVGNPNYGFSSFDHLGWGTLSVFQVRFNPILIRFNPI